MEIVWIMLLLLTLTHKTFPSDGDDGPCYTKTEEKKIFNRKMLKEKVQKRNEKKNVEHSHI